MTTFFDAPGVPVFCNVLLSSREEALSMPRGELKLGFCRRCGHVFNHAFDSARLTYNVTYENSLHFSNRFEKYARVLVDDLIDRYALHGKHVVDIGCGRGDFLKLMCDRGAGRGTGFDPSYVPYVDDHEMVQPITIIRDRYSKKYAGHGGDLICCRHVLEHVDDPRAFVRLVAEALGYRTRAAVFFEVPSAIPTLRDLAIWDLIYEHCSYFTPHSLGTLFADAGFDVTSVREVYGGQYLCLEAALSGTASEGSSPDRRSGIQMGRSSLDAIAALAADFASRYARKVDRWRRKLAGLLGAGRRVVVWGAGSKGVTLLNVIEEGRHIEYVVDVNPRKQGTFVSGVGTAVVGPSFLGTYRPDAIILLNPLYQDEIRRMTVAMGLNPRFLTA